MSNPIPTIPQSKQESSENNAAAKALITARNAKGRVSRGLIDHINGIVAFVSTIAVALVFMTRIALNANMSLENSVLLVAVLTLYYYTMYANAKDYGMKSAKTYKSYTAAVERNNTLKDKIISQKMRSKLPDFCTKYIADELAESRDNILSPVGISLQDFNETYIKMTDAETASLLNEEQADAVKEAKKLKPIRISSVDLMARVSLNRKMPLGVDPAKKHRALSITKFVFCIVSAVTAGAIMLEYINFSFASVVAIVLQLLPGFVNMYFGFKRGFDRIAVDSVEYLEAKSDILCLFVVN